MDGMGNETKLRSRNLYTQNALDFVYVRRIVYACSALNFIDNGNIHVAFLCQLFLCHFFFGARAHRIHLYETHTFEKRPGLEYFDPRFFFK